MAEIAEIKATSREKTGKGAARAARREGLVPAVIYGEKQPPVPINVDYKTVWTHLQSGQFLSTVYMIDVGGEKTRVIPRDIHLHPVRDFPMHVDFLRLGKDARITVSVPVVFENEELSPGLKRGGVLNVVRYDIEVSCPADAIPTSLTVNLEGLEIGDSIHFSAITLPEGVTATITDRDFTVVTIAGAVASEEEEEAEEGEEGAEAAEGEAGEEAAEGEESKDE
ncbi:MAG: 50S ribosomal protein L25/general stress protein Ctc [Methyloligellaceae bacterium]